MMNGHLYLQIITDKKVVARRFENIFQLTCSVLAILMSFQLLIRFIDNKDATSISYKMYNHSPKERYPSFSICFKGTNFHWFHEFNIFKANGLTSSKYEKLLAGEKVKKYVYNSTSRLYRKVDAANGNGATENLKDFHLRLTDILVGAEFVTEDSRHQLLYKNKIGATSIRQPPFYIGYHSPDQICFTRVSNDSMGSIRLYDKLSFNRSIVGPGMYNDSILSIHVHYPEQLMRSLDRPALTTIFSEYKSDVGMKISQGTLLRKREGSNEPCNDEINEHYDAYLQTKMSNHFHCVPPYWNLTLKNELKLNECNSTDKLAEVYNKIKEHTCMLSKYDPPCLEKFDSVVYNWNPPNEDTLAEIKITYKDRYYEEILYSKDLGMESFWAGIGGFAGLFMGFSIMQFSPFLGESVLLI